MTRFVLTLLMSLFMITLFANPVAPDKLVLAIDADHKGPLSPDTLKQGTGYILVKQNPTHLDHVGMSFITNKDNIVTSVELADLEKPAAFKKILMGQFTSSGALKIYTLANLGYNKIFVKQVQNGKEFYLLTWKGKLDRIEIIVFNNAVPGLQSLDDFNKRNPNRAGKSLKPVEEKFLKVIQ